MLGSGAHIHNDLKCEEEGANWEQTAVGVPFFKIGTFHLKHTSVSSVTKKEDYDGHYITYIKCCAYSCTPYCTSTTSVPPKCRVDKCLQGQIVKSVPGFITEPLTALEGESISWPAV